MIRKFVQCRNVMERIAFFTATNANDWTESSLNTVMRILGMDVQEGVTKEEKWELIVKTLKEKETTVIAAFGDKLFHEDEEEVREFEDYVKVYGLNAYERKLKHEQESA